MLSVWWPTNGVGPAWKSCVVSLPQLRNGTKQNQETSEGEMSKQCNLKGGCNFGMDNSTFAVVAIAIYAFICLVAIFISAAAQ
jgi:hypothetical protein